MLIDKPPALSDDTIVLYPRTYNKRGEERLHSVQGLALDGNEVNIKLRIDESMQGKDSTPSIAEFSREDVKAKNPCLATPGNGPNAREGVLLFTGCEPDGENKKGLPTFTARWGYVLASHSDAPEPVFGLGRVAIATDSLLKRLSSLRSRSLRIKNPLDGKGLLSTKRGRWKTLCTPLIMGTSI